MNFYKNLDKKAYIIIGTINKKFSNHKIITSSYIFENYFKPNVVKYKKIILIRNYLYKIINDFNRSPNSKRNKER